MLHGGATAVFRVGSVREAARLAEAIAGVPGLEGSAALLTIADARLTVRLSRDLWQLAPQHVELARAISEVAKAYGAVADRASVQEVQLAIAAKPEAVDVDFWRAVLGYSPMADDNAIDPLGHGSTVWMQEVAGDKQIGLMGANIDQQYLAAGLVDEIRIHLVDVLLGGGRRLFDVLPHRVELEQVGVSHHRGVAHLEYRVVR